MTETEVLNGSARWSLHQGEAYAWLRGLPDMCIDAIVTDPPYSSGGQFRGDRMQNTNAKYVQTGQIATYEQFAGDNRDQRAYLAWCALWMSEALRAAKPGALIAVFTDWRQLPTTIDAVQAGGWVWRGIVPWAKKPGTYRPSPGFANRCEYLVWGSSGASGFPPGTLGLLEGAAPTAGRDDEKFHPTQKPVEVLQDILAVAEAGGVVADPFVGSGTTGVAALLTGRRFLGCELTPHYAEGARVRLGAVEAGSTRSAAAAGQAALFGSSS